MITALLAQLLSITQTIQLDYYYQYITTEELEKYLERLKETDTETIRNEVFNTALLDGEIKEYCDAIAKEFDIDYSEIQLSRETIVSRLETIFAGRNDITKAEVINAIKAIYTEEAFATAVKNNMAAKIENDFNRDESINTLTDIAQEFVSEALAYEIQVYSDLNFDSLVEICSNILQCLNDIYAALNDLDFDRAEEAIEELRQVLESIPMQTVTEANQSSDYEANNEKASGGTKPEPDGTRFSEIYERMKKSLDDVQEHAKQAAAKSREL